jgi:hypothetical protein
LFCMNSTLLSSSTTTIATNPQYELLVSKAKNRAFLKIVGFWRNPEQVANYVEDWKKALTMLTPGFTLVTDAREMKIHPGSVRKLHEEAQTLITNFGVKAVAEIQAEVVTKMQLDGLSKETGMPKENFTDCTEAQIWLDSLR